MRATTSTPPRQVPSLLVGAGEAQRLQPVAQVVEGHRVRQGQISAAPSGDCVNTSQSRLAGETPNLSRRVSAEVPRAEAELRSRSYADVSSASIVRRARLPDLVPHRRPVGPRRCARCRRARAPRPRANSVARCVHRHSDEPADHEDQDQRRARSRAGTATDGSPFCPAQWCETTAHAGAESRRRRRRRGRRGPAPGPARCCSCIAPATTTGPSPRASSTRASTTVAAAVREVAEETGLHVRLGVPLSPAALPVASGRTKLVHYWVGRAVGDDDVSGYLVNDEIDEVAWVPVTRPSRGSPTTTTGRPWRGPQASQEDPGARRAPARRRPAAQALAHGRPAAAAAEVGTPRPSGWCRCSRRTTSPRSRPPPAASLRADPGAVRRDDRLPAAAQSPG